MPQLRLLSTMISPLPSPVGATTMTTTTTTMIVVRIVFLLVDDDDGAAPRVVQEIDECHVRLFPVRIGHVAVVLAVIVIVNRAEHDRPTKKKGGQQQRTAVYCERQRTETDVGRDVGGGDVGRWRRK